MLDSYAEDKTDEFIQPSVIEGVEGRVKDGDFVFFYNFRADRARELCLAFNDRSFGGFARKDHPQVNFMTLTRYEKGYTFPVAYPPEELNDIFGEVISKKRLKTAPHSRNGEIRPRYLLLQRWQGNCIRRRGEGTH
ncbi:MAG: hypothetical protein LRY51_18355 [Geovibrio sp.]|nr:hypothetical protein [Geovibrio sp.]